MPITAGVLRIGGNDIWAEWFSGLIDEVRIYDRALSQTELQADMATPLETGPARSRRALRPVSRPPARIGDGPAELDGADRQRRAVARYNVHRSTTAGLHPVGREPDRAADGTHLDDTGSRRGRTTTW